MLTSPTSLYIVFDKGPESWPPVMLSYCVISPNFTRMSSYLMIMEGFHNVPSWFSILWYIVFSLVKKNISPICIFQSPILQPCCHSCRCFSKSSLSTSAAFSSRLFAIAILSCRSVLIRFTNISSGSITMSLLSLSSSGHRSGC